MPDIIHAVTSNDDVINVDNKINPQAERRMNGEDRLISFTPVNAKSY
jgi:hypothetical protein